MNLVEALIGQRIEVLLKELESISEDVISEGQVKAKSTTIADMTTQGELSPNIVRRLGVVHVQLNMLKTLTND